MKVKEEQLMAMIANQIREEKLDNIFDDNALEEIKEKVKEAYKSTKDSGATLVDESDMKQTEMGTTVNHFPYEPEVENNIPAANQDMTSTLTVDNAPEEEIVPPRFNNGEKPDFLRDVESAKIAVSDFNELSEGGENLAAKPLRSMEDIDLRKSMKDMWSEGGVTEAEVYIIKYEKVGKINFDYKNGTAYFREDGVKDYIDVTPETYHENPYAAEPQPQIETPSTEVDIAKSIESSVDLEKVVYDTVKALIKKGLDDVESVNEPVTDVATVSESVPEWEETTMDSTSVNNRGKFDEFIKENLSDEYHVVKMPEKLYKTFNFGESEEGVEFMSGLNGISTYVVEGKEYHVPLGSSERLEHCITKK